MLGQSARTRGELHVPLSQTQFTPSLTSRMVEFLDILRGVGLRSFFLYYRVKRGCIGPPRPFSLVEFNLGYHNEGSCIRCRRNTSDHTPSQSLISYHITHPRLAGALTRISQTYTDTAHSGNTQGQLTVGACECQGTACRPRHRVFPQVVCRYRDVTIPPCFTPSPPSATYPELPKINAPRKHPIQK
ncbi:hypothetical protein FA13DRAFT_1101943 [Coprinellus micaceus]|uniref:Uncharacterized protein n=1 Tax=Coprinellus micaceus TaxID=71717 RepID=A0A4Y7SX95_COPMI|nr:hypothetical protein FA13DRAFT_1101943 [Coprinellus micaceus]